MQFTDCSVQSANCHIALKVMFYLLIDLAEKTYILQK